MVEIRGNDLQQTDCTTTSARDDDDHIHEDHHDHYDQDHVVADQMQMQLPPRRLPLRFLSRQLLHHLLLWFA